MLSVVLFRSREEYIIFNESFLSHVRHGISDLRVSARHGLRRYFRGGDPIFSIVNGGKDELSYINQMSYWLD